MRRFAKRKIDLEKHSSAGTCLYLDGYGRRIGNQRRFIGFAGGTALSISVREGASIVDSVFPFTYCFAV